MRHLGLRIVFLVSAALLVCAGVAAANGSFVTAKAKTSKSQVRLCLNYKTGHVRAPRANHCKANEKFVTIRTAKTVKTGAGLGGPQGPAGAQGPGRPAGSRAHRGAG